MLTKEQAEQRGNLLFNKMRGEGWKLRVWENLGWQYEVKNGAMSVTPCSLGEAPDGSEDIQFCLMGTDKDDDMSSGHMGWETDFISTDPNEVVLVQVKRAREVLNGYIAAVTHIEDVMGIKP